MGKKKLTEEELIFNEDIKKIVLDILEKNRKFDKFNTKNFIGGKV